MDEDGSVDAFTKTWAFAFAGLGGLGQPRLFHCYALIEIPSEVCKVALVGQERVNGLLHRVKLSWSFEVDPNVAKIAHGKVVPTHGDYQR